MDCFAELHNDALGAEVDAGAPKRAPYLISGFNSSSKSAIDSSPP